MTLQCFRICSSILIAILFIVVGVIMTMEINTLRYKLIVANNALTVLTEKNVKLFSDNTTLTSKHTQLLSNYSAVLTTCVLGGVFPNMDQQYYCTNIKVIREMQQRAYRKAHPIF